MHIHCGPQAWIDEDGIGKGIICNHINSNLKIYVPVGYREEEKELLLCSLLNNRLHGPNLPLQYGGLFDIEGWIHGLPLLCLAGILKILSSGNTLFYPAGSNLALVHLYQAILLSGRYFELIDDGEGINHNPKSD